MRVVKHQNALIELLIHGRQAGKTIGFVPTMGALHAGHLALIEASVSNNDLTVCSIFVNPTQFNNQADLEHYPRDLDNDIKLLKDARCDILFCPEAKDIYPTLPRLSINFGDLEQVMEGAKRPGHFNGVGIVVAKLFNIVQPNSAYFGQKDLQQYAIITQLVRDLSMPVTLVRVPTVREADGLAYSSRNRRLTDQARAVAPALYQALVSAQANILDGNNLAEALKTAKARLNAHELITLEYLAAANANTFELIDSANGVQQVALFIAAFVGQIRLIDNIIFDV